MSSYHMLNFNLTSGFLNNDFCTIIGLRISAHYTNDLRCLCVGVKFKRGRSTSSFGTRPILPFLAFNNIGCSFHNIDAFNSISILKIISKLLEISMFVVTSVKVSQIHQISSRLISTSSKAR